LLLAGGGGGGWGRGHGGGGGGDTNTGRLDPRGIYEKSFERKFLEQSEEYFRTVAQEILGSNNAEVVLQRVEQCIIRERKLVEHCLDPSTLHQLMKLLNAELIEKHVHSILDLDVCSMVEMLNNEMVPQLNMMYKFLNRVSTGGKKMSVRVNLHISTTGKKLIESAATESDSSKSAIKMVSDVLAVKSKYDTLLKDAFQNDKTFKIDIYSGLEDVVNTDSAFPEYLSLFIDHMLKKGVKETHERELEATFDDAIQLFRLLQEKDVFERYYKQHLNKRLLMNKSVSDEAERGVIERLKKECGASFTYKLEGMFKDIRMSTEATTQFQTKYGDKLSTMWTGKAFAVRVLTSVYWTTDKSSSYTLPPDLLAVQELFSKFYCDEMYNGRSLNWSTSTATFDLEANFDNFKRKHTICGSMYQGLVLLAFNTIPAAGVTFRELSTLTGMTDSELKRALMSLALGKFRILTKNPPIKTFVAEDVFAINESFESKYARIKIQQVTQKEGATERDATRVKVESDRRYQIEACVVRVMKARRKMQHNDLIVEVVEQLQQRFTPAPAVLKKRIEHLIEREYLSRLPTDRNCYIYEA
jgi:cullin 3